ncbi:hypothetical protein N3873_000320 [Escherichia coli]|nr:MULTISPECIES: hypothetical protein [Enterobacteriaceae]EEV5957905.1 hypothetical protein [Escherichia coli]EFA7475400.1 hypothetical protein [Escherichia coli]EFA7493643.1 hypothetical protein [Escherichia coli]EFG3095414.1 hypothetical protein [Escherichia coli]EFJ2956322.1 hypothetical protein [Escherichia coli]
MFKYLFFILTFMVSNSSIAKINEIICGSHLVKVNTSNASKVHLDDVEFSLEKEFFNEARSLDYISIDKEKFTLTEFYSGDYSITIQSPETKKRDVIMCKLLR